MNYWRILGITGAAFCTAAIPALALLGINPLAFEVAVLTALLNALIAGFQEIEKESDAANGGVKLPVVLAGVMLL